MFDAVGTSSRRLLTSPSKPSISLHAGMLLAILVTVLLSQRDNNGHDRLYHSSSFFANAQATFCYNDEVEAFGHCYLIINHKMTWMESEIFCQSRGANLVRIDGMDENQWLAKVIPGDAWIGLQRLGNNSASPYGWIPTLEKPSFEQFAPNLRYEDHRCMELETNGTWDDDACWMMQFAICERDPNTPQAIYPRLEKLEKWMEEIKPGGPTYSPNKGDSWGLLASLESRLFSTTIIFSILLVLVIVVMLIVFMKLRRIAPYSSSWGTVSASSLERGNGANNNVDGVRIVGMNAGRDSAASATNTEAGGIDMGNRQTVSWSH